MKQTVLILFTILTISCEKRLQHADEVTPSVFSAEKRLEGTWQLHSYTFNDISIMPELNKAVGNRFDVQSVKMIVRKMNSSFQIEISSGRFLRVNPELNDPFLTIPTGTQTKAMRLCFLTPMRNDSTNISKVNSSRWVITYLIKDDFAMVLPTDSGTYKVDFK